MTELINPPAGLAYDPDSTGWTPPENMNGAPPRPLAARVRCGLYLHPLSREELWGDHRVSFPGTTCTEVSCYVSHYPYSAPGWPEPLDAATDGYSPHTRPGAAAIAAVLWGWNDAGHLRGNKLDETNALHAAHVVLDALRDKGYKVIPPDPIVVGVAAAPTTTPAPTETDARQ